MLSLLTILLSQAGITASFYEPMVVEGRTWWYDAGNEYGIQIGKVVNIEGVDWHELNIILEHGQLCDGPSPYYHYYGDVQFFDNKRLICYIREEAKQVYIFIKRDDLMSVKPLAGYCSNFTPCGPDGEYSQVALYNFDQDATDPYWGYFNDNHWTYSISAVENVVHNSRRLNQYSAVFKALDGWTLEGTYYDIIGSDDIFFLPFVDLGIMGTLSPNLRYVTDPDGSIIYEGVGGYKLWEEYQNAGVKNIQVPLSETTEWYDMYGRRIEQPKHRGVYIKRVGKQTSKIVL